MSICAPPEPLAFSPQDSVRATLADDVAVLNAALYWLQSGHRVGLATVIRTWGSSPRPPGSLMVMNSAGQFVGSVSGGCVEDALIAQYRDGEVNGPTLIDFGVDRQQTARLGLPCGGRLEVLVEELADAGTITDLLGRLARGEQVARTVDLRTGQTTLASGDGRLEFQLSDTRVTKTFGSAWELLLIGDGQVARHLASMALPLDYRVTICDPRDSFTDLFPLAGVRYTREMPDDAVQACGAATRVAVVALAHDPRQDDLGLSAALESQAFYIGAMGSTRSARARRERLASLGYRSDQLDRIHGPAGLAIGSKRPAEIALSILAQITAVRNGTVASVAAPA